MKTGFVYDYKVQLFDKFTVFVNPDGDLDVADNDTELVMTNRITGTNSKVNTKQFADFIKHIFPTRSEQKQILQQLFRD